MSFRTQLISRLKYYEKVWLLDFPMERDLTSLLLNRSNLELNLWGRWH